ncbi:solute carrier family 35 member G1-like [Tachypleus tridentatus]|uniref:solute carrier family 35 member G1-like n=1 Tax=Tachypleus tridentatus TaxID=6853 RepID=UPI003FD080D1
MKDYGSTGNVIIQEQDHSERGTKGHSSKDSTTFGSPFQKVQFAGIGILLALVCPLFYSTQTTLFKLITNITKETILIYRGIYMTVFSCPFIIHDRQSFFIKSPFHYFMLVLRGLCGTGAAVLMYNSLNFLPLGDATVLMMTETIFTTLLALIILREKVLLMDVLAIIIAMLGIILIARPPFIFSGLDEDLDPKVQLTGTLLVLGGAVCNSATNIIMRRMTFIHYGVMIFYYSIFQFLILSIYVFIRGDNALSDCGSMSWLIFGIGVSSFFAQYFYTNALYVESAACVSLVRSLEIVLSYIYQVALIGEEVTLLSGLGALFVTLAVVIKACVKWYTENPAHFLKVLNKIRLSYLVTSKLSTKYLLQENECSDNKKA